MIMKDIIPSPTAVGSGGHARHMHHHRHHPVRDNQVRDIQPNTATPRSNLGPFTTPFAAPDYCTKAALQCATCSRAWRGQRCTALTQGNALVDDTDCWPRATSYPRRAPLAGLGFYSPGLLCPTGYQSACTAVSKTADDQQAPIQTTAPLGGKFQFDLVAGETAVGCCPTGYTCAPYTEYGWQTCHLVATSTTIPIQTCGPNSSITLDLPIPFATGTATVSTMDLWAPLIQINFQSSDLLPKPAPTTAVSSGKQAIQSIAVDTPLSPTFSSQAIRTSISASATSIPASSTPVSPPPPQKITLGAKAGISLASAFGFLTLFTLAFLLLRRYRNKQKSSKIMDPSGSKVHTISAFSSPIMGGEIGGKAIPHELHQTEGPYFETDGKPFHEAENKCLLPGDGTRSYNTNGASMSCGLGVRRNRAERMVDLDTTRFGRSLGVEDELESPIDGGSPFVLQRSATGSMRERERRRQFGREGSLLTPTPLSSAPLTPLTPVHTPVLR